MSFSNTQVHYVLLKGVNVELSPNYQAPEVVSLPYEYVATYDTILSDNECNFEYEIKYLDDYKKHKEEEEKKRIQELKAKAPGLTDKVLEPVRLNSQDSVSNLKKESSNDDNDENITSTTNDKGKEKANIVSEFEDVPPLDPWDKSKSNKDELLQLQMEMSDLSCSQTNNYPNNTTNNITNSPHLNNSNIPANTNTSSPSLSAQSTMSYSTTYQPPVQPIHPPPSSYPPMNQGYQPPVPPQMYSYSMYGSSQYNNPNPNPNEPPVNYGQSMPRPRSSYYGNTPYSNATPPPIPSRPNPQDINIPTSSQSDPLVNSVVDMGFKRELVLNGMKYYGNDKQKIIDYVMLHSYLEGRGFQPKYIEIAIYLYSFNREKCEKFLTAFMELLEMGFEQEAIKEALIFSENDREAAIDHLTKST
ncbi:hypothetical protein BCR36DRAFT_403417 [Piromyces finnis]|uniref:UBA domain-containing protein n=1 Tax=Piromyces finnis TaxID=1754191 RepID=A0A1Y1VEG1_9FUNG|nr:hypothetical protein BCR36DRAFT_403417 [Piromyces finnis]|eukprot:ORX53710.1 hypothetical protein BCR36DRAFT_403417 [Piromyces finnis]